MDVYSVSSYDLTNIPFLKFIASKNKPIILSTGASTLREIKNAISAIEEVSTADIAILHSVMSFPTAFEDANLLMIKDLAENFRDYNIGYSDHTKADKNMLVLITAYNYGAVILEKHFTLDKSLDGEDNCHSMDTDDVIAFRRNLEFLSKIKGYKNKQPLICESITRKKFTKSIVANRNIKKGETIKKSDIAFKIPGTGLSPEYFDEIIGKTLSKDISKDFLITFEMFEK